MQSPVLATIGLSVCLSVCLSHAGIEWKRCKLGSRNLHRRIAQGLQSWRENVELQEFERVNRIARAKIHNFQLITRRISETVQDVGPKLLLMTNIGSSIRLFDWCQNQRPWMTFWTADTHSVAEKMRLSDPTTKIWIKIDPYHQRQKM